MSVRENGGVFCYNKNCHFCFCVKRECFVSILPLLKGSNGIQLKNKQNKTLSVICSNIHHVLTGVHDESNLGKKILMPLICYTRNHSARGKTINHRQWAWLRSCLRLAGTFIAIFSPARFYLNWAIVIGNSPMHKLSSRGGSVVPIPAGAYFSCLRAP